MEEENPQIDDNKPLDNARGRPEGSFTHKIAGYPVSIFVWRTFERALKRLEQEKQKVQDLEAFQATQLFNGVITPSNLEKIQAFEKISRKSKPQIFNQAVAEFFEKFSSPR